MIKRKGMMFILSSPSGAGKTTLSKMMLGEDEKLVMSVSVTTRPRRENEIDGSDYFFVNKAEFAQMTMDKSLLEHAEVFDNHYGTPRKFVEEKLDAGLDVLFDIDWQGTRQIAKNAREDVVSVFILPPSLAALEERLRSRGADSEEVMQKRMNKAKSEISHWDEYDYVVVNENLDKTLSQIMSILTAERSRRTRQYGLADYIAGL